MNFDKLIARLVALGVPALVLIVVVATTGLAGGAAIVAALAVLGGPLGMWGGIALLGLLVVLSQALAEKGFECVFVSVLKGLRQKGHTKEEIIKVIDSYPISIDLKLKLRAYVEQFWSDDGPPTPPGLPRTRVGPHPKAEQRVRKMFLREPDVAESKRRSCDRTLCEGGRSVTAMRC